MGKTILNACIGNVLYEYCWGEHPLKNKGLKELYNVEGGILRWQKEGYSVEKD